VATCAASTSYAAFPGRPGSLVTRHAGAGDAAECLEETTRSTRPKLTAPGIGARAAQGPHSQSAILGHTLSSEGNLSSRSSQATYFVRTHAGFPAQVVRAPSGT
jgi:hypothetical protein